MHHDKCHSDSIATNPYVVLFIHAYIGLQYVETALFNNAITDHASQDVPRVSQTVHAQFFVISVHFRIENIKFSPDHTGGETNYGQDKK